MSAAAACKFAHRVESAHTAANSLRSKPARSPNLKGQSRTSASVVRWLNMVRLLFLSMLICAAALLLALFGVSGAAVVSAVAAGTALVLTALILRPWLRGARSKRLTWSRTLGDPAQGLNFGSGLAATRSNPSYILHEAEEGTGRSAPGPRRLPFPPTAIGAPRANEPRRAAVIDHELPLGKIRAIAFYDSARSAHDERERLG